MIETRRIKAEKACPLRKEVLRKEINLPDTFEGDDDKETIHLGAYLKEELCSVVTLIKSNSRDFAGDQYQLRGMATKEEMRDKGFGSILLETATHILKDRGAAIIWCNAREIAVPFYKRKGFTVLGESFEIDQIGTHYKMYKKLNTGNY
jgi:predicted GNAT family N-acyltransferase